jgi:hypothetical protein
MGIGPNRDDATVSASVPLWVPLVVAGVGLVSTFGAAALTQWQANRREKKQRALERAARQEQWQREDSLRWHQDRQQTYARFLSALYEWDAKLFSALTSRKIDADMDTHTKLAAAETASVRAVAREQLPLVLFMAPKVTRDLATSAVRRRETFWVVYLNGDDIEVGQMTAEWSKVLSSMNSLLKAMRNDLDLEIGIEDADGLHASDDQSPPEIRPGGTPSLPGT